MNPLVITSIAVAVWNVAHAAPVQTISRRTETLENNRCELTNSCTLLRATLDVRDYRVDFSDGPSFGTTAHIAYETSSIETLTEYAVVQLIRGCQFESRQTAQGVKFEYPFVREFFGEFVTFLHPGWVVDSIDFDPVYNSDPAYARHHHYRWNSVPGSFEKDTQRFFGLEKPSHPRLYIRDLPGTAFATMNGSDLSAKNISLEFRSCIYRSADVPLTSTPGNLLPGINPLLCFDWQSSFIYDFETHVFTSPPGIAKGCASP